MRHGLQIGRCFLLMTVLVIIVAVAAFVLRRCLRAAPVLTGLTVCLAGFCLHAGVIAPPAAVTRPIAHVTAAVHAWQQRQIHGIVCEITQDELLAGRTDGALDRASRTCGSVPTGPLP